MKITFLGPPGSGKGTQAERLAGELKIPHVATGDILRDSVTKRTPTGKKVALYLKEGKLVPDEIILAVVLEKIGTMRNFLLDGFPRTLRQAKQLDRVTGIDIVIFFQISEDTIVARLSNRRVCPTCGKIYNLITDPPRVDSACDRCGVALRVRDDDREETVKRRLVVYREETVPLVAYYSEKGVLRYLDADGDPDVVNSRIKGILFPR
ncbi:hypothetical protein AMJ40_02230 [candidate division TA06 bacterium DG_26]|uniref:Adenylate kinase n=1 Tax=candidate division TA06 bacterium DG_26 TaxID=1703771 RepID=A0A0S7WKE8_UNCT6|nr:MAG: hypothetical protein AMJ40_02230 [candidate division TA06 bacterium DG_26]